MKLKEWFHDKWYLVLYSVKHFIKGITDLLNEMRTPTFWFYVFTGLFAAFAYTGKYSWMYKVLPFIFVIYVLIQRRDGRYREYMFKHDLVKCNDTEIVIKRYERYCTEMEITRRLAKSFEEWKEEQRINIIKEVANDKKENA